jgi:hypothetical protein
VEDFDLYILVGRKRLKLIYSQNRKDLRSFRYENNSFTPFYFFSDNNSSLVGEKAKLKFNSSNNNAHYNYFELIKEVTKTFNFFGNEQNIKLLIVRAVEKLINEFLNEIIFSTKNIYELKDKINLNLVFYSDINENEINLVNDLFKKEGFTKTKSFNYNYLLLNYLDLYRKVGSFKGYITSDSIDQDLHLSYYDSLKRNNYKKKDVGNKIAENPIIKIIAERLIGYAIDSKGFNLDREAELKKHSLLLIDVAEKLKSKREFYQDITLSNGVTEKVKIKFSQINNTLITQSHFTKDFGFIQEFHKKTNLQQSDVIFILHGDIHSTHYADKIKSNYAHVYVSEEPSTEIFQLFYKDPECANKGNLTLTKPKIVETKTSPPPLPPPLKKTSSKKKRVTNKSQKSPPPLPKVNNLKSKGPPPLPKK